MFEVTLKLLVDAMIDDIEEAVLAARTFDRARGVLATACRSHERLDVYERDAGGSAIHVPMIDRRSRFARPLIRQGEGRLRPKMPVASTAISGVADQQ